MCKSMANVKHREPRGIKPWREKMWATHGLQARENMIINSAA